MFQEFPYTNFHELNLDWIVKIAKDFLDQYTHIQEVIQTGLEDLTESRETGLAELDQKRLDSLAELNQKTLDGLADLQTKYDTLDGLLQSWYDTHSADIAEQLADAIIDFNTAAETKSQALLDSWPDDYSELVTEYNGIKTALMSAQGYRNFFADPSLEYLKNGRNTSAYILKDIFVSLDMSNNVFVYDNGNVKKAGTTSGSKLYGCTILYDKILMGNSVCFSVDLKTDNITAYLYIRFLDSSDAQISQTNVTVTSSGLKSISADIPANTSKIKVWISSSETGEWSFSDPTITNGVLPISGGSLYWDIIMSEPDDIVDGLQNYFIDPEFTIFANQPVYGNPAKSFDWYIYQSLIVTDNPKLTYNNGMIVKESGTGSSNILYGCKVENDESLFNGHVSFAVDLVDYNDSTYDFMIYIRFIDGNGSMISTVSKGTKAVGKFSLDNDIPANTKTIFVWMSSQSDNAWAIKNPILSSRNSELMAFGANLWDIAMIGYDKDLSAFVTTENELKNALTSKKKIYIADDITITTDINITSDIEIDGMGHTLTANGITTTLIGIVGTNAVIKNLNLVGDATKNYVVVPNTGSVVLIENCKINTSYDSVVRCVNTAKVKIINCDIGYSYNNDGVSPAGSAEVFIYNSVIHDCYDEGVSSHNSSYTECHNCEFYNNGYEVGTKTKGAASSFGGCHIGGGRMGIVESCYSHDNCTYGIGLINFQEDLQTDIEKCFNNVVQNNGSHGIMCTYCKHLTLANNSCIANTGDAIHFGVDPTHSSPQGIVSSGYVAGNIMYENGTDQVVIDPDAENADLHVQTGQ